MTRQQCASGIGAIDDIARTHRLSCFSKGPQRVGIGLDLGSLTVGEVDLDRMHYRLVHAAVIFLGRDTKVRVQISWKAQGHSHIIMVTKSTDMVRNCSVGRSSTGIRPVTEPHQTWISSSGASFNRELMAIEASWTRILVYDYVAVVGGQGATLRDR